MNRFFILKILKYYIIYIVHYIVLEICKIYLQILHMTFYNSSTPISVLLFKKNPHKKSVTRKLKTKSVTRGISQFVKIYSNLLRYI